MLKQLCCVLVLALLAGGPGNGASTDRKCPDLDKVVSMFSQDPKTALWFLSLIDLYGDQVNRQVQKYLYRLIEYKRLTPFHKQHEFINGKYHERGDYMYPEPSGQVRNGLSVFYVIRRYPSKYIGLFLPILSFGLH